MVRALRDSARYRQTRQSIRGFRVEWHPARSTGKIGRRERRSRRDSISESKRKTKKTLRAQRILGALRADLLLSGIQIVPIHDGVESQAEGALGLPSPE